MNRSKKGSTINMYITKTTINSGLDDDSITMFLNAQGEPYNIYSHYHCNAHYFDDVYAWIPHKFDKGDIINWNSGGSYAVVFDDNNIPTDDEIKGLYNIYLNCIIFEKNQLYSCGGLFSFKKVPLLNTEICSGSNCPEELLKLSRSIKAGKDLEVFIREFSSGMIWLP